MRHKVSDIEGALLDAAVAKAEGWSTMPGGHGYKLESFCEGVVGERIDTSTWHARTFHWSTDWSHGGPIIESERMLLQPHEELTGEWQACCAAITGGTKTTLEATAYVACGPTALIAAMRAYVASKFGEEVELP